MSRKMISHLPKSRAFRLGNALLVSVAALSAVCLLVGAGCKGSGTDLGKDVIATVDGQAITVEDLRAANGGTMPEDPRERKGELDRLINNKLAAKVAISEGLSGSPAVLSAIEQFYNDRLPDVLGEKIFEETQVTEQELGTIKGKEDKQPVVGVSVLVAPTLEDADAALAELGKGADFKKVAAKFDPTKDEPDQEFSLGEGLYPAGVKAVLNRLKPGELSPVMKIQIGYAIFRLNYRKEPDQIWKEREDAIRAEVKRAKAQAERASLIDKLRSSAEIKLETRTLPDGQVQYLGAVVNGLELRMDPRLFGQVTDPHFEHQGMNPKTLRDALNKRINDVLLSQEARRRGLDREPDFQRELALAKEAALTAAITDKVKGTYAASEKDMRDYYEKNKPRFMNRTQVRVSRILLPDQQAAESVLKELKSGKDFAALAKSRSTDSVSKVKGGDVGLVVLEKLAEPLKSTLSNMKVGETSGVVRTDYGFELLKVTGRVEGGPIPFSTISSSIRKRVVLNKLSERIEAFYDGLYKKASIKVNEKLLATAK